jgi:4-amino-4-deoxy-L-arabinose transferase-like glycosyltransferase
MTGHVTVQGSRERLMGHRAMLIALLTLGALLRFSALDRAPLGVHQDELSNIYDGWSIAVTGADRYGDMHPGVVRAFGERDYRPALYPWLAALTQKFTGFSITAGRLPAAILGTLSLLLIYMFGRELKDNGYAILALFLAVLSPLHIQLSRVAHEGGILPGFFLILALFLWQRIARNGFPVSMSAILGLVIGLSANSYQSTKLTAVLLAIVVAIDIARHGTSRVKAIGALGAMAAIGALPQLLFLLDEPARFFGRARVLSVPADNPVQYVSAVLHNFWLNLEPVYLFVPRTLRGLTVARLLPTEAPFFYAGLATLPLLAVRPGSRGRAYLYIALFVAILPAALTTDNPATMRASAMAVLTPLFSAAGIVFIGGLVKNEVLRRRYYYPLTIGVLLLTSAAMVYRYARSEVYRELSFQKIGVDLGEAVGRHQANYDAVIVEKSVSQSYLYIAAFTPITPQEFHRVPKRLYSVGMDTYTRLGKYHFVTTSVMDSTVAMLRNRGGKYLFVSPRRMSGLAVVDSVFFRNQKLYFETY